MKRPIRSLLQEVIAVVFKKDELEFRDMSQLEALLRLPAYQFSKSEVDIHF